MYRMLDEAQFPDTVSWGDNGDTFVVKVGLLFRSYQCCY